jgi:hypothetical protein
LRDKLVLGKPQKEDMIIVDDIFYTGIWFITPGPGDGPVRKPPPAFLPKLVDAKCEEASGGSFD